jgi:hypothetical protein
LISSSNVLSKLVNVRRTSEFDSNTLAPAKKMAVAVGTATEFLKIIDAPNDIDVGVPDSVTNFPIAGVGFAMEAHTGKSDEIKEGRLIGIGQDRSSGACKPILTAAVQMIQVQEG